MHINVISHKTNGESDDMRHDMMRMSVVPFESSESRNSVRFLLAECFLLQTSGFITADNGNLERSLKYFSSDRRVNRFLKSELIILLFFLISN